MLNQILQYSGFYRKRMNLPHVCLPAFSSAPGLLSESTHSGSQIGWEFLTLMLFARGTVKLYMLKSTDGFRNMTKDSKLGNSKEDIFILSCTSLN